MQIMRVTLSLSNKRGRYNSNNKQFASIVFFGTKSPEHDFFKQNVPATSTVKMPHGPDWINDPALLDAVNELSSLNFDSQDIAQVKSLGAIPPFESGKDAVDFINNSNTRIKFSPLASPNVHAQYDYENNFIKINEIYKNTQNKAELLAIAEAILHEAGHAKDKDGGNSVQEEIDCLSMNAISHRAFMKKYLNIFSDCESLIIKDGVCVYADLFFDSDNAKSRLVERMQKKYSFLPAGDFVHPPSNLAMEVKMA